MNFPSPDILKDQEFKPLASRLVGQENISTVPDWPDVLLRWWPKPIVGGDRSTYHKPVIPLEYRVMTDKKLQRIEAAALEEFEALSESEIIIPQPKIDYINFIDDGLAVNQSGPTLYTFIKRFQGEPVSFESPQGHRCLGPVTKYLGSRALANSTFLFDIYRPSQYMEKNQEVTLVDMDPYLSGEFPIGLPNGHELASIAVRNLFLWNSYNLNQNKSEIQSQLVQMVSQLGI